MIAPFFKLGYFGFDFSLLIAVLIGFAFGFFLEKGGLGNASKISAQFYFTDLTVFKVMFTAVLTAMLGLYWLGYLGIIDLYLIYKTPTYVIPQLVAGLIFGIGFVTSGLCPGTSCVSTITGSIDGLITLLGLFFGIFVFGETFPYYQKFFFSTSLGTITLPELWNINYGLLVFFVAFVALFGFVGAEALEQKISLKTRILGIINSKTSTIRILAYISFVLAFIAIFTGNPYHTFTEKSSVTIDGKQYQCIQVDELAESIMNRKMKLLIFDLRNENEFNKYHIPRSHQLSESEEITIGKNEKAIIFTDKKLPSIEFMKKFNPQQVQIMYGGMQRWKDKILFPDMTRFRSLDEQQKQHIRKTSRFFGGKPINDETNEKDRIFSAEGCR